MTDDEILDEIIAREGRAFTNDPVDHGGPTRYGITLDTLARHRRRVVTAADVAALTEPEARDIYRARYIRPFDSIPDATLRAFLIDAGVQHGTATAAKFLQRAIGVTADGKIGPRTLAALNASQARLAYLETYAERVRFYGRILERDRTQRKYAAGWFIRIASQAAPR